MLNFITKQHKVIFAAGAATGALVYGLLKTKKIRDLTVKGLAGGIMLKDKVLENVSNIKEEADDIVSEAKFAALDECECDEDCDCSEE